MLLHELPKKTVRRLQKSVTWTDIDIRPAGIGRALVDLLFKINALSLRISHHVRQLTATTNPSARPLSKETSMTQSLIGVEHRWGERIAVDLSVTVAIGDEKAIRGSMRNLSLSGALLRIDTDLRVNALIEVGIELPTPSRRPARLLAYVSRSRNEEVGIEWGEFAPIVVKDLLRSSATWSSL